MSSLSREEFKALQEKLQGEKINLLSEKLESKSMEKGFEDEFFSSLDEKFNNEFFTKSGNHVSGDELARKIEQLKNAEDINHALRPDLGKPDEMAQNAYQHLQDMTPDDAPINIIYGLINKVVQNETVNEAAATITKLIQSLF